MNAVTQTAAALACAASLLLALPAAAESRWKNNECPPLESDFGPFDYTNPEHTQTNANLANVEQHHFTPIVEKLERGMTDVDPETDIHYTLWRFPNHHRALYALANLLVQQNRGGPQHIRECWFERAISFRPKDGMVRMIHGLYLSKHGDYERAVTRYEEALELMPKAAEVYYNLGLAEFKLEDYPQAREHAKKAYELGYPLPGLKNKLKRLGHWE